MPKKKISSNFLNKIYRYLATRQPRGTNSSSTIIIIIHKLLPNKSLFTVVGLRAPASAGAELQEPVLVKMYAMQGLLK